MNFGMNKEKVPERAELLSGVVNFSDLIGSVTTFCSRSGWDEVTEYDVKNGIARCVSSLRQLCAFFGMDDYEVEKRIRYLIHQQEQNTDQSEVPDDEE